MNFILLILLAYLVYMFALAAWWVVLAFLFLIGLALACTDLPKLMRLRERKKNFSRKLFTHKACGKRGSFFSREREIEALSGILAQVKYCALPLPGPDATPYDRLVFEEDQETYDFYEARRRLTSYGQPVA